MKILINTDITPEQQQQIESVSDDLSACASTEFRRGTA